ncbi:MAG TPA: hypothetical protein VJ183_13935 [Chloroflexia bacterium]|nr:hypothetical protein [Chloroflexia bacterium]
MRAIDTEAKVTEDGQLIVRVPPDIPPGEYKVVIELEPRTDGEGKRKPLEFVVLDIPWPADLSLRREDMYGDWGR